jgi:hypothetical protein
MEKGKLVDRGAREFELFFALCKSCFWTASVFGVTTLFNFSSCPMCLESDMTFIPLGQNESSSSSPHNPRLSETVDEGLHFSKLRMNPPIYFTIDDDRMGSFDARRRHEYAK